MKMRFIRSVLVALLFSACATNNSKTQLIYGLGDNELNQLGRHFGYHVEALGMSVYSFTRGNRVFHVEAHNDVSVRNRLQADEPVELFYNSLGRRTTVRYYISVEHGVTTEVVEEIFRRFIREIEPTSAKL